MAEMGVTLRHLPNGMPMEWCPVGQTWKMHLHDWFLLPGNTMYPLQQCRTCREIAPRVVIGSAPTMLNPASVRAARINTLLQLAADAYLGYRIAKIGTSVLDGIMAAKHAAEGATNEQGNDSQNQSDTRSRGRGRADSQRRHGLIDAVFSRVS